MRSRLPQPIQPLIEDYISLVNKQLPNWINGFYLVGSIALDEFNERFSDIDFVAILNRRASAGEMDELRGIHRIIARKYAQWEMSGSYIQPHDLGKLGNELEPHPHYYDGVLQLHANSDLNSVTWWELKNHGISILGKAACELPFSVDWDLLIRNMRENMNSYWAGWTNQPTRILKMYSNWGIQWAVLGVLRQFYTFNESSITTKVRAGQYALGCLPAHWHRLIREAIAIRNGQQRSAYRLRAARMIEAVNFLKYVIQRCNVSYSPR
jgi:hypothetical protein